MTKNSTTRIPTQIHGIKLRRSPSIDWPAPPANAAQAPCPVTFHALANWRTLSSNENTCAGISQARQMSADSVAAARAAMSTTPLVGGCDLQNPPANADYIHRNRTPKDSRISAEKAPPRLGRVPQDGARPGRITHRTWTATVGMAGVPCLQEAGAWHVDFPLPHQR